MNENNNIGQTIESENSLKDLFFSFKGRINRSEYFYTFIVLIICIIGFAILIGNVNHLNKYEVLLGWGIILLWASRIFPMIKRFHDLGKPGASIFLMLLPLYNIYLAAILFVKKGQPNLNEYGAEPLTSPWKRKSPRILASVLALVFILLLIASNYAKKDIVEHPSNYVMSSQDKKCQITIPSRLKASTALNKDAIIQAIDYSENIGVMVIREDKKDVNFGSINDYTGQVKQNILNTLTSSKISIPLELTIDGKKGIQYEIEGVLDKINAVYLVLVVESPTHYYQVIAFTWSSKFENEENEMNEIIHSFKEIN